ncbi:MAG: hypothetical protein AAF600_18595 [Bacteroidota bacterium]
MNANYKTTPSNNNFLGTAYSVVFSSFDAAYGSGVEGGISSSSTVFDEALKGINMSGKGISNTSPRAFLNYIFFDQEMNYVRAGFLQITTAAQGIIVHHTISLNDIIADREGYILAYLSNENAEEVTIHWDDFTVYHGKTNIVYAMNYYPHRAIFFEFVRIASELVKYRFQGHEWVSEVMSYDLGPRMWDPYTLRTNAPDILADQFPEQSPYSLFRGNPLRFTDPTGMFSVDIIEDCYNGANGVGEGIARAFKSKVNQVSNAINNSVNAVGYAINSGLKAADEFVTGDTPDTRGEGSRSNLRGETLVKTEDSKGSQGIVGKFSTENDITISTEAKGVGPALGAPDGVADIVKSAVSEVSHVINTVSTVRG